MERLSLMSDRYAVEVEVREGVAVRVDCFQMMAELGKLNRAEGEAIPFAEIVSMTRAALGAGVPALTDNEAYSIGRRVIAYMESLGKG